MNVVIFGASGATGQHIVEQSLARGHRVTAFVRTPSKLAVTHDALRIVRGNVADAAAVRSAIVGHDSIISALGVGKPLQHDQAVVDGVGHILEAMDASGVRRFIYMSFAGITDQGALAQHVIRPIVGTILRHEIADHAAKERLIRATAHDWTIVYAPKLTNGAAAGRYRSGEDIVPRSVFPTMSRADVADFIVRQLTDTTYIRRAPRVLPE